MSHGLAFTTALVLPESLSIYERRKITVINLVADGIAHIGFGAIGDAQSAAIRARLQHGNVVSAITDRYGFGQTAPVVLTGFFQHLFFEIFSAYGGRDLAGYDAIFNNEMI